MVSEVLSAMSALPASMLHSDAHSNQPHSPHSPLPSPPDHTSAKQQLSDASNTNNNSTTPHSSAASSPTSALSSSVSSSPSHLSAGGDDEAGQHNGHHQQSPAATHTSLPPISEDEVLTPMDVSSADAEPASPLTNTTLSTPSSPQPAALSSSTLVSPSDASASKRKLTVEIPALSAAASSAVTPIPPLHPGSAAATARFDVWMTPAQARAESKKLKGYRWIPVLPQSIASAGPTGVGVAVLREEKRVRKERKYDDELSTITTPTVKRERTGGQTPSGRRQSGSSATPGGSPNAQTPSSPYASFAPPTPRTVPPRNFKRQQSAPIVSAPSASGVSVRALELRLEALKQQQAILLAQQEGGASAAPSPAAAKKRKSTPASFPSHDSKKAKTPDFAVPASPSASPNFHAGLSSSTAAGSPTIHGSSPQLTRTGRSIRAPSHFSAVDPVTLSSDLRRAKQVVEVLMAYKPAFGVFNAPVNFDDPTKPFFAAGYIDAIKGKAMDLGTVKATLSEGGYEGLEDFAADVRQVWRNAQLFNPADDWIHTVSKECEKIFEQEMMRMVEQAQRETERKNIRAQQKAERDAAKLANPDGTVPPASDEYGFPSSSLAEVPMQRASTGPIVRPKARVSMPGSIGGGGGGGGGGAGSGRPLAQREKQMLKDDIFKLPPHKLGPVVEIISKSSTSVAGDDDEIEIDIDKLDVATLRELQEYVKKALAPPPRAKTKPTGITAAGRRSTTPRHSPAGSILQSPPRLSTPEREANAPASPSVASVQSVGSVGAKPIRYESDESSDDSDDEEGGKKALPPVVLPMVDDNEVSE